MKQLAETGFTLCVTLCLAALVSACGGNAVTPNAANTRAAIPTLAQTALPPETQAPQATTASSPVTELCSLVTAADVQNITGVAYDSTNTNGNFPNIKHCEYRGQANVVSLVLVTDSTATERMNRNKQLAHTSIAAFQDEAIWEPVQNLLSVMSGERLVEVRISKTHGDEPSRIEKAKALALLLLSR